MREIGKSGRSPSDYGPGFLYIGTGRSGSTWFFEVLREHPEVVLPANKGTFFFTHFYLRGIDWYEGFFRSSPAGRVRGEVCEDYLSSPEALSRIKAYRGDMRLICCLRNPYERALSAWQFLNRNGMGCATLAEQVECRREVVNMGNYGSQLHFARSLFPESQILVFLFDELTSTPERVVRRLYEFIGVDPEFIPPSLRRTINPNGKPRLRSLARLVYKVHIHSWGRSRLASNLVGRIKRIRPLRQLVRAILFDERPVIENWKTHISEFPPEIIVRYENEISILEGLLNKNLNHWRAPGAFVDAANRRIPERDLDDAAAPSMRRVPKARL